MSIPLVDSIFKPGTKFTIVDPTQTKALPPGSIGFIGSYSGQFRALPNITLVEAAIIRKGKRGKERLEQASFATSLFDIGPKINEPKFRGHHFAYIEPIENTYGSVLEMPTLDFFGWGLAYCNHLSGLFRDMTNRWPKEKYNPVNVMKNNIPSRFRSDPASAEDNFHHVDYIGTLISELRRLEALGLRAGAKWKCRITTAKLKALLYLVWADILKRKFVFHSKSPRNGAGEIYPRKNVSATIEYYLKVLREDQKREFELDQKRFEAYSKDKKKIDPLIRPAKPQPAYRMSDMIYQMEQLARAGATPDFHNILFNPKKNGGIIFNEDML